MYLWKTARLALLSLILLHLTNLSESSGSNPTQNPTSQNPTSSSSNPSEVKTGTNPGTTPSSESTPPKSSTPTTPAIPKDQEKNEKLDPSKFTVLTLDSQGSKPKENDTNQYELKELSKNLVLQYQFNDKAKCVELKYLDQQVWTHDNDKHKDQFPTSIFLHLESKRVYLALKELFFLYTYQNNKWSETEVNLVQLDISKKESTTDYDCVTNDNVGTYTAKINILFKEVIRKKPTCECGSDFTFIQATDPGQYVYKVVRDGTDSTKSMKNVNLYLLNGIIKKFQKTGGCCSKTWSEGSQLITHTSLQNIQVKGVMVAMDDEKSTDEFEFAKGDKTMTYTAKEGYGFNEVKWLRSVGHIMRADRNVWTAGISFNFAKKVVVQDLGWLRYDLHIHLFDNNDIHVYHRPAWGSQWSYSGGVVKTAEFSLQKAENIPRTEHPKEISVVTKDQTDSKDSKHPNNSDPNYSVHRYSVESKSSFYHYEFRDCHECTEFKYEDKSAWTHDASKANQGHPKSAFVFLNTKTVIFCFKEGVNLVSRLDGDQWKSVYEGKPETCAVDINSESSSSGYEYKKTGGSGTYTPKEKHLINTVKTKELVLWNTNKLNQHATKVEIQGIFSSQKTLILHLLNGDTKKFNKYGDNQPWMEIDSSGQLFSKHIFNELSPSNVKIITENSPGPDTSKTEDDSKPNENNSAQYELNPDDGNFFSYKFKDDVKCVEIKYDDESVWKYNESDNKDHPKALYFHKGFKFFFFQISEQTYRFYRRTKIDDNNYNWICYNLKSIDPEFEKQLYISYVNGSKVEYSKDKHEIKKSGFAFEINIEEGVKFVELSYIDKFYLNAREGTRQLNRTKIYDNETSKFKNHNVVTVYLLEDLDYIVVFEKFYAVFIKESKKGTKEVTGGGTGSSGNPATDESGSNPSGGSTPSGGGGTTPDPGGTTPTNPTSST